MVSGHLVVVVLWVAYCVLHSVLAASGVKKAVQIAIPGAATWYRLGYNLLALFGLGAIIAIQVSMPSPKLFTPNTAAAFFGSLIAIGGAVIMAICIRKYFTGLSGLQNLWRADAKDTLIVTGIHRRVRHPLYLGTFLAIWGAWLLLPTVSFLLSNVVITTYTLIGIRFEERKLVAAFGDAYRRYRQAVPMLVPWTKTTGQR